MVFIDFEQVRRSIDRVPGLLMPGQPQYLFEKVRALPEDAAIVEIGLYRCHYFVGPELVTTTQGTYGNGPREWMRTWRFRPGMRVDGARAADSRGAAAGGRAVARCRRECRPGGTFHTRANAAGGAGV